MAAPANTPTPGGQQPANNNAKNGGGMMSTALRGLMMFFLFNTMVSGFFGGKEEAASRQEQKAEQDGSGAVVKQGAKPAKPAAPADDIFSLLGGAPYVNNFDPSFKTIIPFMTEKDVMYFHLDVFEKPVVDGDVVGEHAIPVSYPSLSYGETLPTPEPEDHTDFLNRLIRPHLSSAKYEDPVIVRALLAQREEEMAEGPMMIESAEGAIERIMKRSAEAKKDSFFFPFVLDQPIRNISKKLNLTSCFARNCSLVAKVSVFYQHQTAGRFPIPEGQVHLRVIEIEVPLITFVEKIETEMVSLIGGADEMEEVEEVSNEEATSGALAVLGSQPERQMKKKKKQTLTRTKRSRNKIDSAIDSALQWARGAVMGEDVATEKAAQALTPAEGEPSSDVLQRSTFSTAVGEVNKDTPQNSGSKFVPMFKPRVTISPVIDFNKYPVDKIPPPISRLYKPVHDPSPTVTEKARALFAGFGPNMAPNDRAHMEGSVTFERRFQQSALHEPIIYMNDFWELEEHLITLNESNCGAVPLTLSIEPLSIIRFVLFTQFDQSMRKQEEWGTMSRHDNDVTKKIALESNILLLIVTMCVSSLHSVFEFLAIKNDVSFWRNRKSFKGLSLRTIAVNLYFQVIIFLYLLDSGAETSYMILIPAGISVLVDAWKLRKTMRIERDPTTNKLSFRFNSSYDEKTRSYDQQAMRYLTYLLVPCLIGYSIYSAIHHEHKGWYSFLVTAQVRFIYFSGFIMMTPQIFINYKLKSVTAVPWRTFVYRFLNTIIDDLFAFIITMPTLHRLACFRDDVVFVILLVQRWKYPVDKNRTEDGYHDDAAEAEEEVTETATKAIAAAVSTDVAPTSTTVETQPIETTIAASIIPSTNEEGISKRKPAAKEH